MVVLEALAIIVGALSAVFGFSTNFYLVVRSRSDESFGRALIAYNNLYTKKAVSDPTAVKDLLRLVRSPFAEFDTSEYSDYGLVRRWAETVRLEFKPGNLDQRKNFVGVNPIYGYNDKGEETLVADHGTFHQLYHDGVVAAQQRVAFRVLLVSFLIQMLAMLVAV